MIKAPFLSSSDQEIGELEMRRIALASRRPACTLVAGVFGAGEESSNVFVVEYPGGCTGHPNALVRRSGLPQIFETRMLLCQLSPGMERFTAPGTLQLRPERKMGA